MAAAMIVRNNSSRVSSSRTNKVQNENEDRDDELQAAIRNGELKQPEPIRDVHLSDGPVHISHDTLMGKMPKADKVLKKGDLLKLTSSYEWKSVTAALTSVGLFLSRPGEEVLRDLVPLYEIIEVKKRSDVPGNNSEKHKEGEEHSNETHNAATSSFRAMRISSLMQETAEPMHIIQIRTVEKGYNSGRTYYFKAESDEVCNEWITRLRAESDHAIMLKQAGPSIFRRMRYRLRKLYASMPVQGLVAVLIFASFLANIVQTELLGAQPAEASPVFAALEVFFTAAFTAELAVNFLAHFFRPFFKVGEPRPPSVRFRSSALSARR